MAEITARPGAVIAIYSQSKLGETGLFPQAKILDSDGAVKATVNLSHLSDGLYSGTGTAPSDEGYYVVQKIIYTDSGHTTQSGVDEIIKEELHVFHQQRIAAGGRAASVNLDPIFGRLDDIDKELKKKSEFNPVKEKVSTDIDIKPTSLISVRESIKASEDKILAAINKNSKIIDDFGKKINANAQKIAGINIPTQKDFSDNFTILENLINQRAGSEEVIKALHQETEKIKSIISGIDLNGVDFQLIKDIKNFELLSGLVAKVSNDDVSAVIKTESQKILDKIPTDRTQEILIIASEGFKQTEDKISSLEKLSQDKSVAQVLNKTMQGISAQLQQFTGLIQALNKQDESRAKILMAEIKQGWNSVIKLLDKIDNKEQITMDDIVAINGELIKVQSSFLNL